MIDTDEKLAPFLERVRSAHWLAVDTEADSLHAYPEKLCLIQVSLEGADELVDPLAALDLQPLWAAFQERELIFHGADYDLRLMRKGHSFVPYKIFDTNLAARLLGHREFGLTHLVAKYLGVSLEKGSQKADWARRPLTEKMEAYARNDTRYLRQLSDLLRAELEEKGRLSWHQEWCSQLVSQCARPSVADPDGVWRVKGAHRLNRPALAVLREVWKFREEEAVAANKPPYFILPHDLMVEMSAAAVSGRSVEPLIPRHFSSRRREALSRALKEGLRVEPEQQPDYIRHLVRRPTEVQKQRFVELEQRRNERAEVLGLDPTLIASRATLLELAENWELAQADLMSWQRQLLS